jgi:succinoglycan biosynthesis protein ExoM
VIVVDNDTERSAAPVAEEFRHHGFELIYDAEPERNISLARNRALAHATAEFVATIDDDAVAAPDWLAALLDVARRYEADVVFGAVERTLPPEAPGFFKNSGVFNLPNPPTGTSEYLIYNTVNCLFRRDLVRDRPGPFDPDFGRTGGEDTRLFYSLEHEGAKLVWCHEARVIETVLPERVNLRWVLQRAFREGATYYRVYRKWDIKPDAPFAHRYFHLSLWGARIVCLALWHSGIGIFREEHRARALKLVRELFYDLGVAAQTAGLRYEEYRE